LLEIDVEHTKGRDISKEKETKPTPKTVFLWDIETSDQRNNCDIVEVAIVDPSSNQAEVIYSSLVRLPPGAEIAMSAQEVHGIDKKMLLGKPSFKEVCLSKFNLTHPLLMLFFFFFLGFHKAFTQGIAPKIKTRAANNQVLFAAHNGVSFDAVRLKNSWACNGF